MTERRAFGGGPSTAANVTEATVSIEVKRALGIKDPGLAGPKVRKLRMVEARRRRQVLYDSHKDHSWTAKCEAFGNRCAYCGTPGAPSSLTRDHLVAKVNGGPNFTVPCCKRCNGSKGASYLRDWIKRLVREEVTRSKYLTLLGGGEVAGKWETCPAPDEEVDP